MAQGTARWYKVPQVAQGGTRYRRVVQGRYLGTARLVKNSKLHKARYRRQPFYKRMHKQIQIYMGEYLTKTSSTVVHSVKWVKVNALPIYFWSKVSKTSYALDRQHLYLPAKAKKVGYRRHNFDLFYFQYQHPRFAVN